MTFTPWHIWAAFLLDLAFGNSKWVFRPTRLVMHVLRLIEHPAVVVFPPLKNAVLKMGKEWSSVLLALSVSLFVGGVTALLISFSSYLHTKFGLIVLLYLTATTLTMRSVGDTAYGVFEGLQKNNISFAQKELFSLTGGNTEGMTESEMTRATVLTVAGNSVYGVVAPLLYLLLGGVPLAMAYQAINALHFASQGTLPLDHKAGWARLYDLVNFIPARITGILMVVGAAFLFGTGSKTLMIFLRNGLQRRNPNTEIDKVVMAGAIGMTLRAPSADVEVIPLFPLREEKIDEAELHHIIDAIKLMGVVACVMLTLCIMM
jgi:adenosylcobinamide-phosphate synthase